MRPRAYDRANIPSSRYVFQTHGISYFEQSGRHIESEARRLSRLRCLVSAYDHQSRADAARSRHRAEGSAAGARCSLVENVACKLSARTGTGRIAHDFVHAVFDEATKLSPYNAIGVADSLIDLLLLPLREADTMFDRGGAEATYVRAQFFIREHLRDPDLSIDQISAALGCTKRYLHMLFSDRGRHRQRSYLAGQATELPPGTGDPGRKNHHGCRIFVGLFEFVAFQPRLPQVFRSCSVFHPQGQHSSPSRRMLPRPPPSAGSDAI